MYILTPTLAGGLSGLYKFYEELYRWLDWIIFRHYPEIICLVFDQLKIFERKISVLKKIFLHDQYRIFHLYNRTDNYVIQFPICAKKVKKYDEMSV